MPVVVSAVRAEPVPASVVTVSACMSAAVPAVADVAVADFSVPLPVCMPAVAAVQKVSGCCFLFHQVEEASPVHFRVGRLYLLLDFLQLGGIRVCFRLCKHADGFPWFLAAVSSSAFFISFSYFSRFSRSSFVSLDLASLRPCCLRRLCPPEPRTVPCWRSARRLSVSVL